MLALWILYLFELRYQVVLGVNIQLIRKNFQRIQAELYNVLMEEAVVVYHNLLHI
jgi:hypothetical protein